MAPTSALPGILSPQWVPDLGHRLLSLYRGVLTTPHPTAVPQITQFSARSHTRLRGWAPGNFPESLQRSRRQEDLDLGDEKAGSGEEMKSM